MRRAFLLFVAVLGMTAPAGPLWAQEGDVAAATGSLQDVLSTLKQSVQKLSLDNDRLLTHDQAMKQEILQLQAQLGRLEDQGEALNQSMEKLREKNPDRYEKIKDLQDEYAQWDNRNQKTESAITLIRQSLAAGYDDGRFQKEKLRLMKMIYDSKQRQESLHQSILEYQERTPVLPADSALAQQQILKERIKDLEFRLAAYPQDQRPQDPGLVHHWDNNELGRLEGELKNMERNYAQLKVLMDQMSLRIRASRMTESQHFEEVKLQSSLKDLNLEGAKLKADLDELCSRMVELDKRKSRLEMMVRNKG